MNDEAWAVLIEALRNADDVDHAIRAAELLEAVADKQRAADLYALLDDADFFVREAAAVPLARLEGLNALPRMLQALGRGSRDGHDNDLLSHLVAEILEEYGREAAMVLSDMLGEQDSVVRAWVVWGLGFVAPHISPEVFLGIIERDENQDVRAAAVGSMSSFKGNHEVVDRVIALLKDRQEPVRDAAILALGFLGDIRALGPLTEALSIVQGKAHALAEYSIQRLQERPAAG